MKPLVLDKCIGASLTFNNSICVHKLLCVHMHDEAIHLFTKSSQTTMLLRDHLIDWEVKSVHLKKLKLNNLIKLFKLELLRNCCKLPRSNPNFKK